MAGEKYAGSCLPVCLMKGGEKRVETIIRKYLYPERQMAAPVTGAMQEPETDIAKLESANRETLELASRILRQGGLVAFPTETVYGLGGDALNPQASAKIYAAKGRPSDNPLIVHIADLQALDILALGVPPKARKLAERFWPGPLTMILSKADVVPKETTGGLETVAIRMPSHPVARELIRSSGIYIAAPSANLSGRPSPSQASHVIEDLSGRIEMIIDGGHVEIGLESTIIDLTADPPMILRPGFITKSMLEEMVGPVAVDASILADLQDGGMLLSEDKKDKEDKQHEGIRSESSSRQISAGAASCADTEKETNTETNKKETSAGPGMDTAAAGLHPKAPGMKYRHYAPRGELVIIEGSREAVAAKINALTAASEAAGKSTAVICSRENMELYKCTRKAAIGSMEEAESIAANLYDVLRQMDEENISRIYSESFGGEGLSSAIMNRLLKAAGHRVIRV